MTDYIKVIIGAMFEEPRAFNILKYHEKHLKHMLVAKGSSHNHQYWEGGYYDHIQECLQIGIDLYNNSFRELPFHKYSALIVLYFHDIEKLFKYSDQEPLKCKEEYLRVTLPEQHGIKLTEDELLAIKYIHGEGEDYSKSKRVMSPLAAFCHCVDIMSARIWFDHPNY